MEASREAHMLTRFRASSIGLIALASAAFSSCANEEPPRALAQLDMIELRPVSVRFAPGREDVLVVLNEYGRIDVLEVPSASDDRSSASATRLSEIMAGATSISVSTSEDEWEIVSGGKDGELRWWTPGGSSIEKNFGTDTGPVGNVDTDTGPVSIVALSSGGERIVSVRENGTVRLWSKEGPIPAPLEKHKNVTSVTFSPDDQRIVSGDATGMLRLWTREGKVIGTPLETYAGTVNDVAFSPDGQQFVSVHGDGTLHLWTREGKRIGTSRETDEEAVHSVAFSPDGRQFVSGHEDGTLRLWTHEGDTFRLWTEDGTLRLWTHEVELIETSGDVHKKAVRSVAFSPDGLRIISGSEDGTLQSWKPRLTALPKSENKHARPVRSVAFSTDGRRIVSGGEDGTLRFWTREGEPDGETPSVKTGTNAVHSVAFSPTDGRQVVFGGEDGTVRLLTLADKPPTTFSGQHDDEVRSVAFSPDGERIASGSKDGTLRFWTREGEPIGAPTKRTGAGAVSSVAFLDEQRVVSSFENGTLLLWTLQGESIRIPLDEYVEEHGKGVVRQVALPGGTDRRVVELWVRENEPTVSSPSELEGQERSVAFSPDGKRIAFGELKGDVKLWARDEMGEWHPVPLDGEPHDGVVGSVAFSPDGRQIVSGGADGYVRLLRLESVADATPIEGSSGTMKAVAISSDGERVASAHETGKKDETDEASKDDVIKLWKLDSEKDEWGAGMQVNSMAFSPNGTQLAVGGYDSTNANGTVQLWTFGEDGIKSVPLHHEDREGKPFRNGVMSVAFSPGGERIIAGSHDGTIRMWTKTKATTPDAPVEWKHEPPIEWKVGAVRSVAFSRDGTRIVVGGTNLKDSSSGGENEDDYTVRLLTVKDDGSLRKTDPLSAKGHERSARAVAFSPVDEQFVSGGQDGKMLLWTPEGERWTSKELDDDKSVEEITSVAFSSDGKRIVWGSDDGTVRLRNLSEGAPAKLLKARCDARPPAHARFIAKTDRVLVGCSDRWLVVDTSSDKEMGTLFPSDRGLLAIVPTVGVFPNDSRALVNWVDDNLEVRDSPKDRVDVRHVRQALFDSWTLRDDVTMLVNNLGDSVVKSFGKQHLLVQVLSASSLVYAIFGTLVFGVYLFAPWRLAHWSLGATGNSDPPPWKWLVEMITLVHWVGSWDRPRKDWIRRFRREKGLERLCFTDRAPVVDRERYGELRDSPIDPAWFEEGSTERFLWIHGPGGSGKTALACHLARDALVDGERWPMPLLVDGDWEGPLVDRVAQELTEKVAQVLEKPQDDCRLSASMVKRLGSLGYLCPIVDSLSERTDPDALSCVRDAIVENHFLHMIVTSRDAPPPGLAPEKLYEAEAPAIDKGDVRAFVESYVDDELERRRLLERTYRLLDRTSGMPNALFLRIAIEQMNDGSERTPRRTDLVLRYVKASRKSTCLGAESFRRAASLAALEALRNEQLVPTELTREQLIDTLKDQAETEAFLHEDQEQTVEPATVLKELESCGILRYSRANTLRFTYDLVAECLAAWYLVRKRKGDLSKEPWRRTGTLPESGFARAMRELRADEILESEEA